MKVGPNNREKRMTDTTDSNSRKNEKESEKWNIKKYL